MHQHGIWTGVSAFTRSWRVRRHGASVIAPHGSLSPWALCRSRWKKTLALAAYERSNLQNASCLHALSQREAEELTGLLAGGISPLALLDKGFTVVIDMDAKGRGELHISGGQRSLNVRLGVDVLAGLTRARFAKVSVPDPEQTD